jgi:hypothetical protein
VRLSTYHHFCAFFCSFVFSETSSPVLPLSRSLFFLSLVVHYNKTNITLTVNSLFFFFFLMLPLLWLFATFVFPALKSVM